MLEKLGIVKRFFALVKPSYFCLVIAFVSFLFFAWFHAGWVWFHPEHFIYSLVFAWLSFAFFVLENIRVIHAYITRPAQQKHKNKKRKKDKW